MSKSKEEEKKKWTASLGDRQNGNQYLIGLAKKRPPNRKTRNWKNCQAYFHVLFRLSSIYSYQVPMPWSSRTVSGTTQFRCWKQLPPIRSLYQFLIIWNEYFQNNFCYRLCNQTYRILLRPMWLKRIKEKTIKISWLLSSWNTSFEKRTLSRPLFFFFQMVERSEQLKRDTFPFTLSLSLSNDWLLFYIFVSMAFQERGVSGQMLFNAIAAFCTPLVDDCVCWHEIVVYPSSHSSEKNLVSRLIADALVERSN